MAHDLAVNDDGRTAMMYIGKPPWHGLGTQLDCPATAEEAITAAGLNYDVQLTPLATTDGLDVPQRKAVVRYDTQQVLGVVGNDYVPVQNREAFGFLDAVVAEGGLPCRIVRCGVRHVYDGRFGSQRHMERVHGLDHDSIVDTALRALGMLQPGQTHF